MQVRKAEERDLNPILSLYEHARSFMAASGNPTQWGSGYPPLSVIKRDLDSGNLHVVEREGEVVCVFYILFGEDPVYRHIEGEWLSCSPYAVVHRLASSGGGAGVFALRWAFSRFGNIRIDTHRDNRVMQHILSREGYTRCGVVTLSDGTFRWAYQKDRESSSPDSPVSR